MNKINLMDKYPVNGLEIAKEATTFGSVDDILEYLKSKIDTHPVASYIATFDHYAHTNNLEDGVMSKDILAAKNIICCFGKQLPNPLLMAVKPRSIGVVEMQEKFVISFMDVPNAEAHKTMVEWVESIINK
jgi:hypothetical protein